MTKAELQDVSRYLDAYAAHLRASQFVPEIAVLMRRVTELSQKAFDEAEHGACCERDHDKDGNCDRHPAKRPAKRV